MTSVADAKNDGVTLRDLRLSDGDAVFERMRDPESVTMDDQRELTYWLSREFWGQGIAGVKRDTEEIIFELR